MKNMSISSILSLSLVAGLAGACASVPKDLNSASAAATETAKAEATDATADAKAEATTAVAETKAEVVAATTPHACPMGEGCPMSVKGTTVTTVDTKDGVSLVFVNTGNVEGIRTRVKAMAAMHAGKAAGDMKAGMKGMKMDASKMAKGDMAKGDMKHMGEDMKMPASTAVVTDTEGGATLTLTPTKAADLPALREHAKKKAAHMTGGCKADMAADADAAAAAAPAAPAKPVAPAAKPAKG